MAATGKEATVTEPLKYKIWNLKVSIHCEGCKRKVKKVLQSIEGVYTTTIDLKKQKVTVIGNVEADTLIKKLIKTGKPAELWPEPKPSNPDSNAKDGNGGGKKKNKKNKDGDKPSGESSDKAATKEVEPESETKEEAEGESPAPVEPGKDLAKDSPKTDQKPAGKKKGKKKNNGGGNNGGNGNGNNNVNNGKNGNGGGNAAAAQDNQKAAATPGQPGYNLPTYPSPQYVVSYNSLQPAAAGTYYIPMATVASMTGSYDFFSEENANACIVM